MRKFLLLLVMALVSVPSLMALPEGYEWPTEIIKAQPEGTVSQTYVSSQISWLLYNNQPASINGNYGVERLMVEDGDIVYLQNFLLEKKTGAWIKGVRQENGDVVFTFPQMISDQEGNELYLAMLTPTETEGGVDVIFDPDNCNMTMRWIDGVLTQVLPATGGIANEQVARYTGIVGAVNPNGNFTAFGEKGVTVKPWSEQPAEAPEFTSVESYSVTYVDRDFQTVTTQYEVGLSGDEVWIKGLNRFIPDSYIHGTVTPSGDWVFQLPQYSGVYSGYYTFFVGFDGPSANDPASQTQSLTFFRGDDGTLVANTSLAVNIGTEKLSPSLVYSDMVLKPMSAVELTPLPPSDLELEWDDNDQMGVIAFLLPTAATDGTPLDISRLYYNVYYDGEIHTFTPDEDFVDSEMVDVPALYTNDITILQAGDGFIIMAVLVPYQTVGVRSVYMNANGVTTYSDVVSGTLGMELVTDGAKEVASEVYYNLQGRKVENPTAGLYVVRTTYTDGSVRAAKRMIR